jgi:hypothetical protein
MKSLLKMTWMETKLFLREPVGAFFTLIFPLMMLFLFGSIYGNTPSKYLNGQGTVDILRAGLHRDDYCHNQLDRPDDYHHCLS